MHLIYLSTQSIHPSIHLSSLLYIIYLLSQLPIILFYLPIHSSILLIHLPLSIQLLTTHLCICSSTHPNHHLFHSLICPSLHLLTHHLTYPPSTNPFIYPPTQQTCTHHRLCWGYKPECSIFGGLYLGIVVANIKVNTVITDCELPAPT